MTAMSSNIKQTINNLPSNSKTHSIVDQYSKYLSDRFSSLSGSSTYYAQLDQFLSLSGRPGLQDIRCVELSRADPQNAASASTIRPIDFDSNAENPRISVVEGFPSPDCVAALALRNGIRPELLIGHLGLEYAQPPTPPIYTLPSIPSRRKEIVHIHLITLGRFTSPAAQNATRHELLGKRVLVEQEATALQEQLFTQRRFGETRFRKIHVHNTQHFTFEQMVSFSSSRGDEPHTPWQCT